MSLVRALIFTAIPLVVLAGLKCPATVRAAEVELSPDVADQLADYRLFYFDTLRNEIRVRRLTGGEDEHMLQGLGYYTQLQVDQRSRYLAAVGTGSLVVDLRNPGFPFAYPARDYFDFADDRPLALWGSSFEGLSNRYLLDLSDPASPPSPLTDHLPAESFEGALPFAAFDETFGRDGVVFITIDLEDPFRRNESNASRVVGLDTATGTVLFQREIPFRSEQTLYDESNDALLVLGWGTFLRLDPDTGETDDVESRWFGGGWRLVAGQLIYAWSRAPLLAIDPTNGNGRRERSIPGTIEEVFVVDESGLLFLLVRSPQVEGSSQPGALELLAFDTTTFEVLARIGIDPTVHDGKLPMRVAVAKLPADWQASELTVELGPTPTYAPTPTPTPCPNRYGQVHLADATSYPDGDVNLEFTLDIVGDVAQASVEIEAERSLGLHYRGGKTKVCSVVSQTPVRLSQRMTSTCSGDLPFCYVGRFMVSSADHQPLPRQIVVSCRFIVGGKAERDTFEVRLIPSVDSKCVKVAGGSIRVVPPPPTPTPSPRPTATPTAQPTPCRRCSTLEVSTSVVPGSRIVVIEARLQGSDPDIVALQADFHLAAGSIAKSKTAWRCRGNPLLPHHAVFKPGSCGERSCDSVRTLVFGSSAPLAPVPTGTTILTCRVELDASASLCAMVTVRNAIGSDAAGKRIDLLPR